MDAVRQFFAKISGQFGQFWSTLNGPKKAVFATIILGSFLGIGALFAVQESEPYKYLFTEVSSEDQQDIVDWFKRNGIEHWETDAKGIRVPEDKVADLRIRLTQEGLPNHGVVGWEKFDNQDFTRTEFEQNIHKLRAIQGELQRTIMMVQNVVTAKVHIVMPRKTVFVEDQKDPTAAVYIKTKRGMTLEKKQIKGITHLVSRSVEGLTPSNVTIIDNEGKMLTEPEPDTYTSKLTKERLAYKKAVESKLEDSVRRIVGRIVGPDRVEVKVDAELDFTQEQQTISEVDPETVIAVAKDVQGYSLEGNGLNPYGIPGAKSNVPGQEEEVTASGNSTKNKKDHEKINYEFSKTISQRTMPVGNLIRLSAAVLVDGKQEYPLDQTKPEFEPRSTEEMSRIESLVKNAIGFDDKRGDSVKVVNEMFQLDQFQIETIKEENKEKQEYLVTLAVSGAVAFALVGFFGMIVRPYFRWLSYDPDRKKEQQLVEEFKPDLELGALQNVQIKEDIPFEKLSPQEQVIYLAKNEPKRTTEAIRLLLNPHQG